MVIVVLPALSLAVLSVKSIKSDAERGLSQTETFTQGHIDHALLDFKPEPLAASAKWARKSCSP